MRLCRGLLFAEVVLAGAQSSGAAVSPADAINYIRPRENKPLLTNALQARQLAPPEAVRGYPVRLRGVVTFHHSEQNELFLQDITGGVRVRISHALGFEPGVGQLLEVEGEASGGDFGVEVKAQHVALIGEGPMPALCQVTEAQLAAGEPSGSWVEVQGVIHKVQPGGTAGLFGLELATPHIVMMALIKEYNFEECRRLVDAEVAVAGVLCRAKTGQPELRVPFMGDIRVIQPAPSDPFAMPTRPIRGTLEGYSLKESLHRVKVEGSVTLQQPGRAVFIQSGTNSMLAFSEQKTSLQPGDVIAIAGFPAVYGSSRLRLDHAVFRKLERGPEPLPIQITAEEAATSGRESALVTLEGTLLRCERGGASTLQMRSSSLFFRARLNANRVFPADLREGSRLRLTGICLPWSAGTNAPASFELLLRSPADVTVVKAMPPSRNWLMGFFTAVLLAFLVAWRLFGRRAVKQ